MYRKCKQLSFVLFIARICHLPVSASAQNLVSANFNNMVGTGREIYVPPNIDDLTADAKSWYLKGLTNAKSGLDSFGPIASSIEGGGESYKALLRPQLASLLTQAKEANDNTQTMIPTLTSFVQNLDSWTSSSPISSFSKLKLKVALWYIDGKRDNKSYYLQNGAGLWCKLRVDTYLKPLYRRSTLAEQVGGQLDGLMESLLEARDELDDAAQIYVKGIQELVVLVKDIGRNEAQIRAVVATLVQTGTTRASKVLDSAKLSVQAVQNVINQL